LKVLKRIKVCEFLLFCGRQISVKIEIKLINFAFLYSKTQAAISRMHQIVAALVKFMTDIIVLHFDGLILRLNTSPRQIERTRAGVEVTAVGGGT
jgi:hypothetical protein